MKIMETIKSELEIHQVSQYIPYSVNVRITMFKQNYNGNEFGVLNGVYPLYDKDGRMFWQYTTHNNSTGQSLKDCQLCLRPLKDLVKRLPNGQIPIIELYQIAYDKQVNYDEISFDIDEENFVVFAEKIFDNKSKAGFEVDIELDNFGFDAYFEIFGLSTEFQIINKPKKIIEYLLENHFDIDFLINKGLAIEKNF